MYITCVCVYVQRSCLSWCLDWSKMRMPQACYHIHKWSWTNIHPRWCGPAQLPGRICWFPRGAKRHNFHSRPAHGRFIWMSWHLKKSWDPSKEMVEWSKCCECCEDVEILYDYMVYLLNCHSDRKRLVHHQPWIPIFRQTHIVHMHSYAISCGSNQDDCLFLHDNLGTSNQHAQEMHLTAGGSINPYTVLPKSSWSRSASPEASLSTSSAGKLWAPPLRPFARARNCWDWELLPKAIERHRFCAQPPGSQHVFGISVWSSSQLGQIAIMAPWWAAAKGPCGFVRLNQEWTVHIGHPWACDISGCWMRTWQTSEHQVARKILRWSQIYVYI